MAKKLITDISYCTS